MTCGKVKLTYVSMRAFVKLRIHLVADSVKINDGVLLSLQKCLHFLWTYLREGTGDGSKI